MTKKAIEAKRMGQIVDSNFSKTYGDSAPSSKGSRGKVSLAIVFLVVVVFELLLGIAIFSEVAGKLGDVRSLVQLAPAGALVILGLLVFLAVVSHNGTR